jgi:general secretion pathway protein I
LRTSKGFTLIEVVVAFALLTLVFAVGFEIFAGGLARAGALDERSRALEVARSRQAIAGVEDPLKEGQSQGESADPRFRWTTTVTPFEVQHDPSLPVVMAAYALYRVETRVDWHGADEKDHTIALSTLQLGNKPQ